MTILITGGAGFIGSHLADRLTAEGATVRVLDDLSSGRAENLPKGTELLVGDVADGETVQRASHRVAAIFHLAAITSTARALAERTRTRQVNATGTAHVLDAAAGAPGRETIPVVYASSAAVYGDNTALPLTETATPRPLSPYAIDKLASESYAEAAGRQRALPTVGLRFFNVYGGRQHPHSPDSGVISIFTDRAVRGDTVEVHGDGEQTRDFVHVDDVVDALLRSWRHARSGASKGEVFNVCTGQAVSIARLATKIIALTGRGSQLRYAPLRAGEIRQSIGDPTRARDVLGFRAATNLADGLTSMVGRQRG
jgi:UDP-glucose 4-epimerase